MDPRSGDRRLERAHGVAPRTRGVDDHARLDGELARTFEITNLDATVKIRFWADPWVPGQTRLTVEPVYRPRYDPSRVERELEVIVPKEHEGYKIAQRFVDKQKERFGVPKAAR